MRRFISSALACVALFAPSVTRAHSNGESYMDCSGCHSGGVAPTVAITSSTASPFVGTSTTITIKISTPNGTNDGFSMRPSAGSFVPIAGQGTKMIGSDITHSAPKLRATDGFVYFDVTYTAPLAPMTVTLNAYGNSVDGDGIMKGDMSAPGTLSLCIGSTVSTACGSKTCGSVSNGCISVSCGTCPSGWSCVGDSCVAGGDAGVDTGVADTGTLDTGVTDTGPIDTGPIDTGVLDTGAADTSVTDTSVTDTSVIDSALADTSPADTGVGAIDSSEPLDTATTDSGVPAIDSAANDADPTDSGVDAPAATPPNEDSGGCAFGSTSREEPTPIALCAMAIALVCSRRRARRRA